jgi:hypothetical protein
MNEHGSVWAGMKKLKARVADVMMINTLFCRVNWYTWVNFFFSFTIIRKNCLYLLNMLFIRKVKKRKENYALMPTVKKNILVGLDTAAVYSAPSTRYLMMSRQYSNI